MEIVHKHFDSIDSTNTWALHNAHLLPRDKITLVTADSQSGGRGRFKHPWISPPGQNIYASFCFFIEKHRPDIGNLSQLLTLSAAKVIECQQLKPTLKWPNDVLIGGKKIAGVLTETTTLSDMVCIISGIGLNINMPLEDTQQIGCPVTSLFLETGRKFQVSDILEALRKQFNEDLEHFIDEGFYPFINEYRGRILGSSAATTSIRFNDNKTIWEGTIEAINDDGSLNLRLANGAIKTFLVGEVLF